MRSSCVLVVVLALVAAPIADAGAASFLADRFANNMMAKAQAPAAPAVKPTSLPTRMVLGALGGMGASTVCHPLDVVRVQMQVSGGAGGAAAYKNPLDAATQIAKREGFFKGLYTGIDAAYLRQWCVPSAAPSRSPQISVSLCVTRLLGLTQAAAGCVSGHWGHYEHSFKIQCGSRVCLASASRFLRRCACC